MLRDIFRILLNLDPNDPRNGGGGGDAPGGEGDDGNDAVGDESGGTALLQDAERDAGTDGGEADDTPGDGEGDGEGETEGADGAAAKKPATEPFKISDRDRKLIAGRINEATLAKWQTTPEGQAALRDLISDARDELIDKSLNGNKGGDDDAGGSPIDYDGELAKLIPDFAPDEETTKELAEILGEKGHKALTSALGANKQVRTLIGNIAKHQDRFAGQVSQHVFDAQLAMFVEQVDPAMDDTQFDALRAKVAAAAQSTKNLTPRAIIKLAKQAREELNAPQANRKAREEIENTMQKRAKHTGALPDKNAKPPAAKPKGLVETMQANGQKWKAERAAKALKKK